MNLENIAIGSNFCSISSDANTADFKPGFECCTSIFGFLWHFFQE